MEYLFRGRKVNSKEWVYGYYCPRISNAINLKGDRQVQPNIKDFNGSDWLVDKETVGLFTGLTDKNGKKIFEGDILASPMIDNPNEVAYSTIKFGEYEDCNSCDEDPYIGFYMVNDEENLTLGQLITLEKECGKRWEVTGNIFDKE